MVMQCHPLSVQEEMALAAAAAAMTIIHP